MIVMSPLHPRRGARGDGSLGPPSRKEQELREVSRQIAELAPQKFATVREAFRYLRPDYAGRVSRSEVCYFFRAYGVERSQANRLFAYFDPSEKDDIDCKEFIEYFRRQIHPEEEPGHPDYALGNTSAGPSTPRAPTSELNAAAAGVLCAQITHEFHYDLEQVRAKAPQRFSHVREALRLVDGDYDGAITRGEMQHFFRAFGVDEMTSDRFFNMLAADGSGGANYHLFVQVVGPFLELPGVVASVQTASRPQSARSRPSSARSRPSSARSRPPSAQRHLDPPGSTGAVKQCDDGEIKSVLESALSSTNPLLPAVAAQSRKESPAIARHRSPAHRQSREGPLPGVKEPRESSQSGRDRSRPPLSARKDSKAPPEILVCESPRVPDSARSDRKPQGMWTPAPQGSCKDDASKTADNETMISRQGSILVPQKLEQPFEAVASAPPPKKAQGRRPMGIQRGGQAGVQHVAAAEQKVKDFTQVAQPQDEIVTVASREALTSGGRRVATPRRPPSRARNQLESM